MFEEPFDDIGLKCGDIAGVESEAINTHWP